MGPPWPRWRPFLSSIPMSQMRPHIPRGPAQLRATSVTKGSVATIASPAASAVHRLGAPPSRTYLNPSGVFQGCNPHLWQEICNGYVRLGSSQRRYRCLGGVELHTPIAPAIACLGHRHGVSVHL
jgi:hypothetical protein